MSTIIQKCKCFSPFQDNKYGLQMRVHRICKDGDRLPACTVCVPEKWSRTFRDKWKANWQIPYSVGGNTSLCKKVFDWGEFSKHWNNLR